MSEHAAQHAIGTPPIPRPRTQYWDVTSAGWRFLEPPFVDHSSPVRGTSDLEPRLKRPIDRDYSHALVGFLLMRRNDRGALGR